MSYSKIEIYRSNTSNKQIEFFDIAEIISNDGRFVRISNINYDSLIDKIKVWKSKIVIIEPWRMCAEYLALLIHDLLQYYDLGTEEVTPRDEDEYKHLKKSVKLIFTLK